MTERNRIMELYRTGIITKEDAIRLLEEEKQELDLIKKETGVPVTPINRDDLSKQAAKFADKMTQVSTAIDKKTIELKKLKQLIQDKKEALEIYLNSQAATVEDETIVEATKEGIEYSISELQNRVSTVEREKEALEKKMENASSFNVEDTFNRLLKSIEDGRLSDLATDTRETINEVMPNLKEKIRYYSEQVVERAREEGTNLNVNRKQLTDNPVAAVVKQWDASKSATILDVKLASGAIHVEPSSDDSFKIVATFETNYNYDENELEHHISKHLVTRMTDEETKIHYSSRQVKCHVTIYLPEITMDHVSLKVILGDVNVNGMKGQDYFIKIKTGQVRLAHLEGTMIEVNVQTGSIHLNELNMKDLVVGLKTGNAQVDGSIEGANFFMDTGELQFQLGDRLKRLNAEVKTGSIHWFQMNYPAIEADLRTKLGKISIPYAMDDIEVIEESHKQLGESYKFHTLLEENPVIASIKTNVGHINGRKGGMTFENESN
ncbi:DUF4097 family beta strand repeat-containing protein [Atopobacter phocae]|uniref:DUF4097 family beta strand repeat-containing protein n=1 Tax=Atopobacter phocae TaxID=136492 RepID=UPI0004701DC0|nr:DUF4097 family beta strand repeat-containing protein [Atopobacter phocae]